MLSCREITQVATDYLDGDMNWMGRMGVSMHLAMCRHCRAYVDSLRTTITAVRGLPHEPAPASMHDALLDVWAGMGEPKSHDDPNSSR
jgi:anti-sigma factor RsiW